MPTKTAQPCADDVKGGVLWEKVSLFFPRPNEYATMELSTNETRIVPLPSSGDVLTEVIRQGILTGIGPGT